MTSVLVVTGSARPNSANSVVVGQVRANLERRSGVSVTVADLAQMNLPYMDALAPPSSENYEITDPKAKEWSQMVASADAVVFVSPEYNHSLSGIQKNAIDWLYKEWNDKPAAFVGYGAYAGKHSWEHFREINSVIKLKLGETMTGLQLGEHIGWDNAVLDEDAIQAALTKTFDELLAGLKSA